MAAHDAKPLVSIDSVSDYVIPDPEPKEIDEKLSIELRHLADNAVLKAKPQGNERCETSYKDRAGKYMGQRGVTLPKL